MSQEADIPISWSFHEDSTSETLSAAAQMNETVSWQVEVNEYHKITRPTKLTQEIYWGDKTPGKWLPLLKQQMAENCTDREVIQSFLGREWSFSRWSSMSGDLGRVGCGQGPSVRAHRILYEWNLAARGS